MKKIYRELQREFPAAKIENANGGHIRLRLPNGRSVFVSATPSCRLFLKNVRGDVKRAERREAPT
jgi:hypothetical protein